MNDSLGSREHYEIMQAFERTFPHVRKDKEPKADWRRGIIYQDGAVNDLFKAYRLGVSFGKACAVAA